VFGIPGVPPEGEVRHGQIDLSAIRPRCIGTKESRGAAANPQGVVAQDPRVVVKQSKRAVSRRHDLASDGHHEKEPVVLEDDRTVRRGHVSTVDSPVPYGFLH
jgi:hypothetical protein